MVVDVVCCELVSAEFPVKQGKYREFQALWALSQQTVLPKIPPLPRPFSAGQQLLAPELTGNFPGVIRDDDQRNSEIETTKR